MRFCPSHLSSKILHRYFPYTIISDCTASLHIIPPQCSRCRDRPKKSAWINGTAKPLEPYKILQRECPFSSFSDLIRCVGLKLYHDGDEFDLKADLNGKEKAKWEMKYRGGLLGACHTFHYPHPTGTDPVSDAVQIRFHERLSYNVYIHDPHFFLPTINPSTFPSIALTFKEGKSKDKTMKSFYIEVILISIQRQTIETVITSCPKAAPIVDLVTE